MKFFDIRVSCNTENDDGGGDLKEGYFLAQLMQRLVSFLNQIPQPGLFVFAVIDGVEDVCKLAFIALAA